MCAHTYTFLKYKLLPQTQPINYFLAISFSCWILLTLTSLTLSKRLTFSIKAKQSLWTLWVRGWTRQWSWSSQWSHPCFSAAGPSHPFSLSSCHPCPPSRFLASFPDCSEVSGPWWTLSAQWGLRSAAWSYTIISSISAGPGLPDTRWVELAIA